MINKTHNKLKLRREEFLTALPFPHLILDDFFTKSFYNKLIKKIEMKHSTKNKKIFTSTVENEKTIYLNQNIPIIQEIAEKLSAQKWLKMLEEVSNLDNVCAPDIDYGSLSNFHQMNENGVLVSHVDHSCHPNTRSKHVLNIIIYLSKDWHSKYGGNTLLYDHKGKKIIKKIDYIPNRAVLFLHTPYSFHGVDRISGNRKEKRKSFYIDYYSDEQSPYDKLNLNFPNKFFDHGTTFILPKFTDYLKIENIKYTRTLIKYNLNKMFR